MLPMIVHAVIILRYVLGVYVIQKVAHLDSQDMIARDMLEQSAWIWKMAIHVYVKKVIPPTNQNATATLACYTPQHTALDLSTNTGETPKSIANWMGEISQSLKP